VGFVIIIVRVGQSLVDVNIGGDARNQFGVTSRSGRSQGQVLDGQTFSSFSFVAEGLDDQLVNGLDALDDEVTFIGSTTDDSNGISVLFIEKATKKNTKVKIKMHQKFFTNDELIQIK
jgi:hypothetical protein